MSRVRETLTWRRLGEGDTILHTHCHPHTHRHTHCHPHPLAHHTDTLPPTPHIHTCMVSSSGPPMYTDFGSYFKVVMRDTTPRVTQTLSPPCSQLGTASQLSPPHTSQVGALAYHGVTDDHSVLVQAREGTRVDLNWHQTLHSASQTDGQRQTDHQT